MSGPTMESHARRCPAGEKQTHVPPYVVVDAIYKDGLAATQPQVLASSLKYVCGRVGLLYCYNEPIC